jgi:hypothetical protein
MSMAIDTLEYTKSLEAAGVPRQQAEAHAQALKAAAADQLATKQDLLELEMRVVKYMVAQAAAIVGLVGLLLRFLK